MDDKRRLDPPAGWKSTVFEIAKWVLTIALLLPLRNANVGPIDVWRVALGILCFVIFGGKLLYDIIIADILQRKRQSAAKDAITLIGMVLVATLVVGMLLVFSGWLFIKLVQQSRTGQ
ncbi:hypothetical protein KAR48_08825 [bacterium]|nr:hypothetical protein [bacterium]